jgi:hypothetical protein
MTDKKLEELLTSHFAADARDEAGAERVLRSLSTQPLPPQRRAFALRWPSVLLNWDFTPAWPRVAAFAACAALGFAVGLAGIDGKVDEASAVTTLASADLPSLVSDAEPLTGARP